MTHLLSRLPLLLAVLLLLTAQAAHATWNASWTHRAKVTLNTADSGVQLGAAVNEAVVLVRLHTGNFQFLDAKPDGSDLRFIAADDKTPLKHHIEKYDGINELAVVWVQVPVVRPGAKDDFIWLYYGNANAPAANDARGTYDAQQGLVWHFGESESVPQDSTANASHAQRSGAKAGSAGLIGGALTFDGTAEVALDASPPLRLGANGWTLSMWVKPADVAEGTLWSQREGSAVFSLSLRGGRLAAQAGSVSVAPAGTLQAGAWQHVAMVVKDGVTLYVNGQEVGKATGGVTPIGGAVTLGRGYKGELDELQVSSTARSVDALRFAAVTQGPEQRVVSTQPGSAEGGEGEGTSYMAILLNAVTLDGWIVIGILAVMFVHSFWVMIAKINHLRRIARDNAKFSGRFAELVDGIRPEESADAQRSREEQVAREFRHSQLWHLYAAGVRELRQRFDAYRESGRSMVLTEQSLAAIRASVEARLVREIQRLNQQMVVLTIAIAGGPFLGLLGTVVGVMITFAAIAAAGDVNVNAIAPGIAAALVATVAGLAVAIPALFGYNYLTGRINALTADMQVFVDELTTRFAERHSV